MSLINALCGLTLGLQLLASQQGIAVECFVLQGDQMIEDVLSRVRQFLPEFGHRGPCFNVDVVVDTTPSHFHIHYRRPPPGTALTMDVSPFPDFGCTDVTSNDVLDPMHVH